MKSKIFFFEFQFEFFYFRFFSVHKHFLDLSSLFMNTSIALQVDIFQRIRKQIFWFILLPFFSTYKPTQPEHADLGLCLNSTELVLLNTT